MNRKAFTMIELLTVIAIIAILAAIIFPVGARVKANAYRSADMSAMNDIRNALQLYKADQEAYPPQLLGYASLYFGGTNNGQVVPADQARGFLYPKREPLTGLKPSNERDSYSVITTAVWPPADPTPCPETRLTNDPSTNQPYPCNPSSAAGAQVDLNGDGQINAADDTPGARQNFGPRIPRNPGDVSDATETTVTRFLSASDYAAEHFFGREENIDGVSPSGGYYNLPSHFYNISGYDVAKVGTGSTTRTELRYTLFWSTYGLGAATPASNTATGGAPTVSGGGNKDDDPRQLGYADPPDNTVITWNSFWRDYDQSGNPVRGHQDIVLTLGGGAKAIDSVDMDTFSWRIRL